MTKEISIFVAYLEDREIASALTEDDAREAAKNSHWLEEPNDAATISEVVVSAHEIDAELKYAGPEATNHLCWQCPVCGSWFSDDYYKDDTPPLLTSCDWTRKHPDGETAWGLLRWTPPAV